MAIAEALRVEDIELPEITQDTAPLLLHDLQVSNFRCLYTIGPVPVQTGLTVLAGQNDGGKSTFIDAVSFLLSNRSTEEEDRSAGCNDDDPIEVIGTFYSVIDQEQAFPFRIRARQMPPGPRLVEVRERMHRSMTKLVESMTIQELKERIEELSLDNPGGTRKQPYAEVLGVWLDGRPEDEFEDRWRPLTQQERSRLPQVQLFSSATIKDPVMSIQEVVRTRAAQLMAEEKYAGRLRIIETELNEEMRASLDRIGSLIVAHCPEIQDIEISTNFVFDRTPANAGVRFIRDGNSYNIRKAGQGRLRRVTLAIYEANLATLADAPPTGTNIVIYDEPDTHLDYKAQRQLFNILAAQASLGHVQVMVATHSKNFIDVVPLESLLHFRLNEQLQTEITYLTQDTHEEEVAFQSEIYVGLGFRNSTFLDDRCFLVVEGETEMHAIPILFSIASRRSLVASAVELVNCDGSGSIKKFITMLKKVWNKQVVLLVDMDTKGKDVREKWMADLGVSEGAGCFFIGATEFEDAFSDEIWLEVLQTYYPVEDGAADWTLEEVAAMHQSHKFSEALIKQIFIRTGNVPASKPDLGRHLALVCKKYRTVPESFINCVGYIEAMGD
jgi:putative ATP-dependent endonuclease of the OLD family